MPEFAGFRLLEIRKIIKKILQKEKIKMSATVAVVYTASFATAEFCATRTPITLKMHYSS